MRAGVSLPETVLVLVLMGTMLALGIPRAARWLDRVAVQDAVHETTMAIALARERAIAWGARTRVTIRPDIITIDTLGSPGWGRWAWSPGAAARGVTLTVSNPRIEFVPIGMAWGFSNTKIVLSRGFHNETITVSRVGRVKRW